MWDMQRDVTKRVLERMGLMSHIMEPLRDCRWVVPSRFSLLLLRSNTAVSFIISRCQPSCTVIPGPVKQNGQGWEMGLWPQGHPVSTGWSVPWTGFISVTGRGCYTTSEYDTLPSPDSSGHFELVLVFMISLFNIYGLHGHGVRFMVCCLVPLLN